MQPWFTVYVFSIAHPCCDQLTPVKTRYPLTISRAQVYSSSKSRVFLKLTADQVLVFDWIAGSSLHLIEVTCFLKLTAAQVLVFDWIAGRSQVNLLKTGQDCLEAS